MPAFWNARRANRSVHAPWGAEVTLPSIHFTASVPLANSGASLRTRKMLHCCLEVPSTATMRMSVPPRSLMLRNVDAMAGMSPM